MSVENRRSVQVGVDALLKSSLSGVCEKNKSSARRRFCVKGLRDTAVAVNQVVPRAHALIWGQWAFLFCL